MLMVAGCSEKDKVPSGVIAKDEMEKILWDMMLADQYSANYIVKDSAKVNVKIETLKLYEDVFRLHKVTRDEFRKSFEYYQGRPDITRTMLDSLQAKGNRARAENYTRPPGQGAPVAPSAGRGAAVAPPVGKGTAVAPPVVKGPAKDTIKSRVIVTPGSKQPAVLPNRPYGNPAGTGNPNFLPGRPSHLPPGVRPFLPNGQGRPFKAGETPFKPVKKDSVTKGRQ
jgi:hypothetical protein